MNWACAFKWQFAVYQTENWHRGPVVVLQEKEAPARPNLSSKRPTVVVPDPVKTYLTWAPFPPSKSIGPQVKLHMRSSS